MPFPRSFTSWPLGLAASRRLAPALFAAMLGAALSPQTFAADITVASPLNGTDISSPVWIRAHNIGCSGLAPTAFGYSVDNAAGLVLGITPYDIDVTTQALPGGSHIVHFKSWTSAGVCPVVNSTFTVGGSTVNPPSSGGSIPSNAISSGNLDGYGNWDAVHDGGTSGGSKGSSVYPATTPVYDDARKFYMTYYDHGGERWSLNFGHGSTSTYFVLDTYVYLVDPLQVENLELDINQVMPNGETVILGTQCSGVTGTWESAYTSGRYDHWLSSNIHCNPREWSANQWHHIQIAMHRDNNGVVTHDWVNLDGTHSVFSGAVRESAHFLGWGAGDLVANFQIEGENSSSGSVTSYIHEMTVLRW
jgi:hypothetical protein